jgi:hypothetical protein
MLRKTYSVLSLLLLTTPASGYFFSGLSEFSVRTPFQTASPEKEALWHYDALDNPDEPYPGSFEVVPFYGHSLGRGLDHFFSPHGKSTLDVIEFNPNAPSEANDTKDFEARHFNIETRHHTFHSVLRLHPRHSFYGAGLAYRQRIWNAWWVNISTAVMRVKNEIVRSEHIINDGGGVVSGVGLDGRPRFGSVTQALESQGMRFGRIDGHSHEKTGLADIEFAIGWDGYNNGTAHYRSYVGGVFPTGNRPDARFLFPPVIGNNHHYGVLFGGNIGFILYETNAHIFRHEIDTHGRYLFPNEQERSFDLEGREWSRYMEVYSSRHQAEVARQSKDTNAGSFGINVFTRRVRVEPRFSTTFNTALIWEYCALLTAEVGYNFFARQGEKIIFQPFNREVALKHVKGAGITTRSRTIKDNFSNDELNVFRPIRENEFDENSAAHPPVIAQTIYAAVGYRVFDGWCPTTLSVGGSYEFSHSNSGLRKWMVWGKLAFDF